MDEVKEVLRYAMMKIGLRGHNLPTEIEKAVILNHIFTNYSGHTLEEMRMAFDMALVGKLDVDPNCYENFSCEYISRIMRAYRKWAGQEFKELPTPPPPEPKKIESTSDFSMLRWLAQEIRYIRTGKPVELVSHQLYDYLDKRGKITVTDAEKLAYFKKAIAYREMQLQKAWQDRNTTDNYVALQAFRQMRKDRRVTEAEYETLQRLSKKLLFFDLVQKQPDATRDAGHDQPCA